MPASPTPLLPLSVVIIALNEESRIGDCIDSVACLSDDIIVVDAGSHDHTPEISRLKGARVFARAWNGYSAQKNFGNAQARHSWILSLDADERLSPQLAADIRHEFANNPSCEAYRLRFHNFIGGKRVRFGAWNPEFHIRLFNRHWLHWNQDSVHEGLRSTRLIRTKTLPGEVLHFTARSQAELAHKNTGYAALFADKARREGRQVSWTKVWFNPLWRFFRDYIIRAGFLDGLVGWQIACEGARYTFLKYRLIEPIPLRRNVPSRLALGAAAATLAALIAFIPGAARHSALFSQQPTTPKTELAPKPAQQAPAIVDQKPAQKLPAPVTSVS